MCKKKILTEDTLINIEGVLYQQDRADKKFIVGDIVLDTGDMTHGVIDFVHPESGTVVIRDGFVVELNIDPKRVIKLKKHSKP